jgi:hypothetical protein
MNGKSNRTSATKSRRKDKPVDLNTARRMLPLVSRIAADIVQDSKALDRFRFELNGLDREKTHLSWPERERRYAVQGEVDRLQKTLEEQKKELDLIGAVLVNPIAGQVDFPTLVNGRPAYFSWQIGDKSVEYWHFDDEEARRPIPPNWSDSSTPRPVRVR